MGRIESAGEVRVPFAALTVAVSVGVATFFTLYSLIPVTRTDSPGVGSAFVGVLMTCVIAVQVGTPALVRRFSLRAVIIASLAVLGVGALVAGIAGTGTASGAVLAALLAGGAIAGAGFGVLIVAGSQGVGLLVPGLGLGRALGVYGLVTVLATALGSPTGVQVGLSFSPTVFGVAAAVLCALGAAAAVGIPTSVGRGDGTAHPGGTGTAETSTGRASDAEADVESDEPFSRHGDGSASDEPQATTTAGALRVLALTLTFLLLAVLFLSHGITSLPVLARDSVGPAATILLVQLGTAGGRWLGGFAEPRITRSGTIMMATVLLVVGATTGVFTSNGETIGISAIILGLGVGTAQTVALHTAMRRTDAGTASVVWNLSVDGGLWLGGILAGLVLAQGAMLPGIFAAASILAIVGAALAVKETGRR